MSHQFIDRLIDWKDFERFVHDMYAEDERLKVEHDVTVTGVKRRADGGAPFGAGACSTRSTLNPGQGMKVD
jgi:hypothetical protein